MMQKRTLYSLLLTSLFLVFAVSSSFGQDVTFSSPTALRCQNGTIDVTVNAPEALSGIEIVFEITGDYSGFTVDWVTGGDFDAPILPDRDIFINGNVVRMYALEGTTGDCLDLGLTVVAQISFTSAEVCDGTIGVAGTTVPAPAPIPVVSVTQFTTCTNPVQVLATAVNAGTVTITNAAPVIGTIAGETLPFGGTFTATATATDEDLNSVPGGCEVLTFTKIDPSPANLVCLADGSISWTTTFADVCDNTVTIEVMDDCGDADTTDFVVCVYNAPPVITCPDDIFTGWGDTVTGTIDGFDPEGMALEFSEVSFDGPGDLVVDGDGTFSWVTLFAPEYTGVFTACVAVTDNANICPESCSPENADTCCFTITVVPFLITIEKVHMAIQGQVWPVSITMLNDEYENYPIGGYDLLITYDPTALLVYSVDPGNFIDSCGWEYFTYRYGPNGNCGPGACPSGFLRIVAIAETNNGDNHPDCFTNEVVESNELAQINFLVSNDRTLECQYVPIRFAWYDCGDNALSSVTGDSLFISRHVYDYTWNAEYANWTDIAATADYPTLYGAQDVDCLLDQFKDPFRFVDFRNGGIDIACADSIDARGDVNLNEIAYEIADAVLFSKYFVEGLGVFTINPDGQIAATDVNADGIALSVADLVYLIRVVIGDALPYPKTVVPVNASYVHSGAGVLSVTDEVAMGAAFVVMEGNV
ncbi:MAG: hypothetical protein KAT79_04405, partial [candidate division Zixibacteria bacterium]|nr:hypothetical protein [candidate division Zixibacteria bacterium]